MSSQLPPRTKYRFEFCIDANSHEEIADAIHALHVNYWQRMNGRDEASITSSDRTTTTLRHLNPDMTPERYVAELKQWADDRRESRKNGAS